MTKGSNGSGKSASNTVATAGYAYVSSAPVKTTVSYGANGSGGSKDGYQTTSRISYSDKQSGSYGRATATEKVSAGDFHWKNGTTGTRSEYTQSSTVRVGDKSGYTEVHREQSVRNVIYDRSSSSKTTTSESGFRGGPFIVYGNDSEY